MAPMDTAFGLMAFSQRQLDRLISPETRSRVYDRIQAFAAARPLLFTFIVAQVLTGLLPIALFLAFTGSILALSVGAALLFSLFWLSVALLFLIPALFVTVSLGFLVFLWALAARFAWSALPARVKESITAGGQPRSAHNRKRSHQGPPYPSYAAASAAAPVDGGGNGKAGQEEAPTFNEPLRTPSTLGVGSRRASAADDGVADLEKFKEEKAGTVTP